MTTGIGAIYGTGVRTLTGSSFSLRFYVQRQGDFRFVLVPTTGNVVVYMPLPIANTRVTLIGGQNMTGAYKYQIKATSLAAINGSTAATAQFTHAGDCVSFVCDGTQWITENPTTHIGA